jgi:mevalonate kinase
VAKKLSHKIFNAKILLFGEHIINRGARGLAVPLEAFGGMFDYGRPTDRPVYLSNKSIDGLCNFIIHHPELEDQYDTNTLLEDLGKGLFFDSNIPQGYGLGSSGALVAAVYSQYNLYHNKKTSIADIKKNLAKLENYYHGKSSGLDALVCYLNQGVIIDKEEVIEVFPFEASSNPRLKVFVIDTMQARKTGPWVNMFLERCRDKKFAAVIDKSLVPANNAAIDSFRKKNYEELLQAMQIISQVQHDNLIDFIPKSYQSAWRDGLKNNQYLLKICGAGGGGFIIGMTKADVDVSMLLREYKTTELFTF